MDPAGPAFAAEEIEREKKVVVEEIKMVEDTPDDLVHELFTQGFWENHPLGRPILGTRETVESFKKLTEGEYDHLPEQAFFLCGGIEDVERRAAELEKE